MEIKETLFSKSFSLEHEDPHTAAMSFMQRMASSFRIYEKKNIYETDGPVRKSTIVFDAVEPLDPFSSLRITFSFLGENETMYVDISGYFVLKVKDYGFFTEIFTEFYLKSLFPGMRRTSEKRMKELEKEIQRI